jgi:hypothetical protein
LALDADKARAALRELVAAPLGRELLDCAHGVFQVACGTMVRAVKAVSTYRGRDPRDFALFAFGGSGPMVAAAIADMMEMTRVVVPPRPGVFSAHGLLMSDIEHEALQAYLARFSETDVAEFARRFETLKAEVDTAMCAEGYTAGDYVVRRMADLRYAGQAHELTIPVAPGDDIDLAALARAFGDEHERTYGHQAADEEVESVALRVVGTVAVDKLSGVAAPEPVGAEGARRAFFGSDRGLGRCRCRRARPSRRHSPRRPADRRGIRFDLRRPTRLDRGAGCRGQHHPRQGRFVMHGNADPITMEVVRNALSSIADEMALVIMRTAYSSIVRDSMDYSTGVCDRHGRVVAHGLTMALHLGSFPDAMQALVREYDGRIRPGDVFVFNDPYVAGGMHLPDVYIGWRATPRPWCTRSTWAVSRPAAPPSTPPRSTRKVCVSPS